MQFTNFYSVWKTDGLKPVPHDGMTDYLLLISYPPELEEVVFGRLFLTRSKGSVSDGVLSAYFDSAADRDAAADALRDLPIAIRLEDREPVNWLDR